MDTVTLNAEAYYRMICSGASELSRHADEVNDLNVFPIPDGDTGTNMTMTISGGANSHCSFENGIGVASQDMANAMLLSARGNSGVILSQFFAGIAEGLTGLDKAGVDNMKDACRSGVKRAYSSVVTPTEGTILTVAKDATNYACNKKCDNIEEFFANFLDEAYRSLERTPDLLKVLKEAGVVDSGARGLIYIMEGMYRALSDNTEEDIHIRPVSGTPAVSTNVNVDMFTSDMTLKFGYCTELLIRLQDQKVDTENFDTCKITDYLDSIGGNSMVCFKNGSIVKLHVHTMTPDKVLAHCQKFGEFLTVKIENMMLQHNEAATLRPDSAAGSDAVSKPKKKYGIVTVANGEGIKAAYEELGAYVIEGGQTMNPSAADFIESFQKVNAKNIFVLPNNGNIFMAASQAAKIYTASDVRVIPTKTIGDGYAVLSMLSFESDDNDKIEQEMNDAMEGVDTIEISKSIRDAHTENLSIKKGDYIGILGKEILSDADTAADAAKKALDLSSMDEKSLVIIIKGKNGEEKESKEISEYIKSKWPLVETVEAKGGQDIYDFYLVLE